MRREKIHLLKHLDLKCGLLNAEFNKIAALEDLVKAIEKDYNNEKIDIPQQAAVAAKKLGEELVQTLNDWASKGRRPLAELRECIDKCVRSINNHRADIEAAPGFSNWFYRQMNKAIAAINSYMAENNHEFRMELFDVTKTQMSHSAQSIFKPAVKVVRTQVENDHNLDVDPSLDL